MEGLQNLKEDFLYRALRTDEDPYKRIVCKDPNSNRTIDQHVKDGLKFPSKYISTTASFDLAERWIRTSAYKSNYKRGTTIVKIDVNILKSIFPHLVNSAYNFTKEDVIDAFLTGESKRFASRYDEVVFGRDIPLCAICNIHVVGKGWIGIEPPRSEPTQTSTSTPTSFPTPITSTPIPTPITSTPIPTPISTAISTPLHASTRSLISRYISPTLTTTSSIVEHKNDASSQNTTLSANISSSLSIFNVSDISSASVSALETSAGIIDVTTPSCDTAEKRRTGVKRSCGVDSEIKLTKYVCVDDKDTQVSVYIG